MLTASDISRALDNTQPYSRYAELGLFHFWRQGWPDVFDNPFARHHYRILKHILDLYHPKYHTRHERQGGVIIHREAGKSTLNSFAWPLTCIWLKGARLAVRYDAPGWEGSDLHDYDIIELPPLEENFILIASETATRSENFVNDIKVDLETRPDLDKLFGPQKPVFVKLDEDEITSSQIWRKNAFTTANGTTVWGIGAGQQTRGIKVRNKRPSLIITDDMYSRKNTKTDTNRENLNYWYFAELENSADTQRGKSLWVGTIVHTETVPTKMLESDDYKTIKIPLIEMWELEEAKKLCKQDGKKFEIPSREKCLELQKRFKTMSWPERHDLHSILKLYKKSWDNHDLGYFYQEYLNIAVAPEEIKFQWDNFQPVELKRTWFEGQEIYTFEYQGMQWYVDPVWYYGGDLASSESVKADEAVIARVAYLNCISSVDNHGRRRRMTFPYIGRIEHGRGWNQYEDNGRKGFITELAKEARLYPGKWYEIDAHATQVLVVREAAKYFRQQGIPGVVNEHKHVGDKKSDFILSVLEPVIQKYEVILFEGKERAAVYKMYQQLTNLGQGKAKDDIPDAISMGFLNAKPNQPLHPQSTTSASPSSKKRRPPSTPEEARRLSPSGSDLWEVM